VLAEISSKQIYIIRLVSLGEHSYHRVNEVTRLTDGRISSHCECSIMKVQEAEEF